MKLLTVKTSEAGAVVATYEVEHHTPGRDGTVLTFQLDLRIDRSGASVSVDLGAAGAPGVPQAMNQMAVWLNRASLALQNLKEPTASLPIYL